MSETHQTAAVLAIGDELTLGQKVDTNSAWLSARLLERGVRTLEHATVSDDLQTMVDAVRRLRGSHDLVIITGGLGPTADDLTRQALAEASGDGLVEDDEALAAIRARYDTIGRAMPATNAVQALRPSRAECLANPHGTAPGLFVSGDGGDCFALPGPPKEMMPMFEGEVLPRLRRAPGAVVRTGLVQLWGIGESNVAEMLGGLMDRDRNPLVGTTASGGTVTVRIRQEGGDEVELEDTLALVRRALPGRVYAEGGATLEEAVVARLRERGETFAVVESCTGGGLGERVTSVPGSSGVFAGGWLTYAYGMKTAQAGVEQALLSGHGAVSRVVAEAMSAGGLERAVMDADEIGETESVDHCVAVTGVAGPGASEGKPAGTVWIARASRGEETDARLFRFPGNREDVRQRAVTAALWMLWDRIRSDPFEPTEILYEAGV